MVLRPNHFKWRGLDAWTRWHSVIGIFVIGLLIILLYPASDEPVYHFKTVTQWLDKMALFDELRNRDEDGSNGYKLPQSPEVVTNDPALRALMALGSKAVPILVKRLNEPPLPPTEDALQNVESWTARQWEQIRGSGPGAPPAAPAPTFGSFQQGRMAAAGLAMLALGTNHQAGALRLLKIAAASQSAFFALQAFTVANAGLPERHKEIIAGIVAGLNDTNTEIQLAACSAIQRFHTNQPEWKNKLIELTQGPDAKVSQWALWSLICADPRDVEIMNLCEKAVQNTTKPPQMRSFAATGLGMAGDRAEQALPFLQAVLAEQDIPKGSNLPRAARQAIERIEKSVALHNANGDSTATRK